MIIYLDANYTVRSLKHNGELSSMTPLLNGFEYRFYLPAIRVSELCCILLRSKIYLQDYEDNFHSSGHTVDTRESWIVLTLLTTKLHKWASELFLCAEVTPRCISVTALITHLILIIRAQQPSGILMWCWALSIKPLTAELLSQSGIQHRGDVDLAKFKLRKS